jgi:hypothetical protein
MEAASPPETLVSIYQATWHHIPEDCNVYASTDYVGDLLCLNVLDDDI